MNRYDVAVIGSGFAGSLMAMIARREGRSVILLEKDRHPRFAIGESSTPLSNLLLEELALKYDLTGIAPLCKWGSWQAAYPHLDCGLKRGFTFFSPDEDDLLVAASPNDNIADTHWHRAPVDEHFMNEARRIGVDYREGVSLTGVEEATDSIRLKGNIDLTARFVVDATGPRGFLHRALSLPEAPLPNYPPTQSLFTHFRGVAHSRVAGPTPYPADDAAVHCIFEGGWIWVLRFKSGITSAGVAMRDDLAQRLNLAEGAPAWERLLDTLPAVRDLFSQATVERPFIYAPRLAFRSGVITGKRWALLPSAAGFVDPLLSTGFPLTLLGVTRLAAILEQHWETDRFRDDLSNYARQTDEELLATARLIGSLYAAMNDFPRFVSLSLIYFAAASYSETVRRLNKPHLAESFLLCDHPSFGLKLPAILEPDTTDLHEKVMRLIEPFNVAGLGLPERCNRYPALGEDLLQAAPKVEASREDIKRLLARCGFPEAS